MAVTPEMQTVGKSIAKPDSSLKAVGSARYTGDVHLAGMLQAKILRPPHAHARIMAWDTREAEALPGVYAVVTGRDIPETARLGRAVQDRHALAKEQVVYPGDPVAAVAAIDEETAQRALDLIHITYEPLPGVFDPEMAIMTDAPVIHPGLSDYPGIGPNFGGGNVQSELSLELGNTEAALQEPGLIIHEALYRTPRQSAAPMEPHAATAQVDANGRVTVWASCKAPFRNREGIARTLGIPASHVRIISPAIGGDFGSKGTLFIEPIAALLAWKARRPVRLVLQRTEEFTSMEARPRQISRIKLAARPDGTLVALEGTLISDVGGVDDGGSVGPRGLLGPYKIPNVKVKAYNTYTNTSPSGHVRAPSGPQNHFVMESALDTLSRKLGIDPFELRRRNAVKDGEIVPGGRAVIQNSGLEQCAERAEDWRANKLGPLGLHEGVGVALSTWSLGPRPAATESSATVRVDIDGSVVVLTGATDQGGGQWGLARQVASEVLGVPVETVSVIAGDTDATPTEQAIGGSGGSYRMGTAVRQAAQDAREQILRFAADHLKADIAELTLRDGVVRVAGDASRHLSLTEVGHLAPRSAAGAIVGNSGPVRAREFLDHGKEQMEVADAPSFAYHVVKVRVDPQTGQIEVPKYYIVQDVGKALNPMYCEGQLEGGVVMGLGYALTEELLSDGGTNINANLWEYLLPTAPLILDLTAELVEVPSTYGPFGAKG
ncbi:MAG: hypothetical protein EXR58_07245, partial [Chloroflexi bacterium]|nr:hypothetical protein [Chloroflexota bacterium]